MNVEAVLKRQGLRREDLSVMLHSTSLAYACLDGDRGITIDTIGRVADALECDVADLFRVLDETAEQKAERKLNRFVPHATRSGRARASGTRRRP